MLKEFVTYEIAVKLRELGFDDYCLRYYYSNKQLSDMGGVLCKNSDICEGCPAAPLWQQVRSWLLHNHGVNSTIDWYFYYGFHYFFKYTFPDGYYGDTAYFDTPEESEAQGLIKVLELLEERLKLKQHN
jgi:hypothetical protein